MPAADKRHKVKYCSRQRRVPGRVALQHAPPPATWPLPPVSVAQVFLQYPLSRLISLWGRMLLDNHNTTAWQP